MTEEELRRYAEIGVRADIQHKARAAEMALVRLREAFDKASGMYDILRFRAPIDDVGRSLNDFVEAMEKKEAYESAGQVGTAQAEEGRSIPVGPRREDAAGSGQGPSGVDDAGPEDIPEATGQVE